MKKLVLYTLAVLMVFGIGLTDWQGVSAKTKDELEQEIQNKKKKQEEIEEEKSDIQSDKAETEEKIEENLNKQDNVNSEIDSIDQELADTRDQIATKENEITDTNNQLDKLSDQIEELNAQIEQLKEEIKELKDRIEQREEMLKDRLRAIQSNGGSMKYIEVIFGAKNFGDLISRSSAVNTIMDQDKNIMETHMREKQQVEDKQAEVEGKKEDVEQKKSEVEDKKASLENQKQELESLKSQLDEQMAEKESLLGELEDEESELEEYKVSLDQEQELLQKQEAANKKAMEVAEQEKEKLDQLAKQDDSGGNSGNSSPSPSSSSSGNGMFSHPLSAGMNAFTSGYKHRWGSFHHGIDYGVGVGTSVKSAAAGSVSYAGTMNGYGNVVLVRHYIDGSYYTTLYAHLSSISVSVGQSVSTGQTIAASGNTGRSTGPHLHFEIHKGDWNNAKSNSVNPLNYLN